MLSSDLFLLPKDRQFDNSRIRQYVDLTLFNKSKAPTINVGAAMKRMEKLLLDNRTYPFIFLCSIINDGLK
jgi:hypothetical protein